MIPNPWDVDFFQDFQFYNCPACKHIEKEEDAFVNHVRNSHEESKTTVFFKDDTAPALPVAIAAVARPPPPDHLRLPVGMDCCMPCYQCRGGVMRKPEAHRQPSTSAV